MRRAMHAARHRVEQCAVEIFGAAMPRDIAAKSGSGAGKDLVAGFVQRKGHELTAGTGLLDQSRRRIGSGLAQIDEHDVGLCLRDFRQSRGSRSTASTSAKPGSSRKLAAKLSRSRCTGLAIATHIFIWSDTGERMSARETTPLTG